MAGPVDGGTVSFFGQSTIAASGACLRRASAGLTAEATITSSLSGVFRAASSVQANASFVAVPKRGRKLTVAIAGDGSAVAAAGQFLVKSELGADASASATAKSLLRGVAPFQADASATGTAHTVRAGVAAIQTTSVLTGDVKGVFQAATVLSSDATLTAAPLGEDQLAADVKGDAATSASLRVSYSPTIALEAGASIRAHAIVRLPLVQIPTVYAGKPEDPMEGLRAKDSAVKESTITVVTTRKSRVDISEIRRK